MMDMLLGAGQALAFAVVGVGLMVLGYKVVDWLTPGDLGQEIYAERNRNAAVVVASGTLAVAAIITTAIATSADAFGQGLLDTAVFGLVGILLQGASFLLLDAITPGKLAEMVVDPVAHPVVYVVAATHVGVGAIVSAAIA